MLKPIQSSVSGQVRTRQQQTPNFKMHTLTRIVRDACAVAFDENPLQQPRSLGFKPLPDQRVLGHAVLTSMSLGKRGHRSAVVFKSILREHIYLQ